MIIFFKSTRFFLNLIPIVSAQLWQWSETTFLLNLATKKHNQ